MLLLLPFLLSVAGCEDTMDRWLAGSLGAHEGTVTVDGIGAPATIRRDAMGVPLIEAGSLPDLAFAQGYSHAADRLAQMNGLRMVARGRLAEMAGGDLLPVDRFMRALQLERCADNLLAGARPETRRFLQHYADGVNAWMHAHRDHLPLDFRLSGYHPDPWQPVDSASVVCVLSFGLAFNLREELAALVMLSRVTPGQLAWLLPVYPDEPPLFAEAGKLAGLRFAGLPELVDAVADVADLAEELLPVVTAASNNWAVAPRRTVGNASVLANDTHLPIALPSLWNLVHLRAEGLDVAGFSVAGMPGVVGGYNGDVAWGMTMVMGDNQDLFLEQLRETADGAEYLHEGAWRAVRTRTETIRVRDADPVTVEYRSTHHGVLLNDVLPESAIHEIIPERVGTTYGIALQWAGYEKDTTLDALLAMNGASSAADALHIAREIRAMPLNLVVADRDHIGWQVTGRFPQRRSGRGLFPSPGWTSRYDWNGLVPAAEHPAEFDPERGWIGTANHRTTGADHPAPLSASWYYPERAQRIAQLLDAGTRHSWQTSQGMQTDQYSLYADHFAGLLGDPAFRGLLESAILDLEPDQAARANEALRVLEDWDGALGADSRAGLVVNALLESLGRNLFLDELGPEDHPAWQAFLHAGKYSYGAQADHLFARGDESPFWDDIETPEKETRPEILARSLAGAIDILEQSMGSSRDTWSWGDRHRYHWRTDASIMAEKLGGLAGLAMGLLDSYVNRGPFPAGGDHTTLNTTAYPIGAGEAAWMIPAVRMIVDFSLEEPLRIANSTGQSGNPASPHYDDSIPGFLAGNYRSMPFRPGNINRTYTRRLTLQPRIMTNN